MIRNLKKDFNVNDGLFNKFVIFIFRLGNFIHFEISWKPFRIAFLIPYKILNFIFIRCICNADVSHKCRVGVGLSLPHGWNGIVIHEEAVIGINVTIFHQVTIGKNPGSHGAPVIEDNVFIGVGAKIIGNVKLGSNSKVGANTTVVKDVPPFTTIVGAPSKIITRT